MKVSSNIKPDYKFQIREDKEKIIFYANITEATRKNGATSSNMVVWNYDKYVLPLKISANTAATIDANYDEWLIKAKQYEYDEEAKKIRNRRDILLNQCDIKYCNPEKWDLMDDATKTTWRTYKQALRDIPTQEGFPYVVAFPSMPFPDTEL